MTALLAFGITYIAIGILCAAYYWRKAWRTCEKATGHRPDLGPLLSISLAILFSWYLFAWAGTLKNFSIWEK